MFLLAGLDDWLYHATNRTTINHPRSLELGAFPPTQTPIIHIPVLKQPPSLPILKRRNLANRTCVQNSAIGSHRNLNSPFISTSWGMLCRFATSCSIGMATPFIVAMIVYVGQKEPLRSSWGIATGEYRERRE